MAQVRDELLDHEYDGIREYNNPLPRWWLWLFYGTILFSVVYVPYYLMGFGPSTQERYEAEMAAAEAARPAPTPQAGGDNGGQQPAVAMAAGPEAVAAGKEIYTTNCAPCHGPLGQGVIGPNLTDQYWIHGNTAADIVHVIAEGVPEKGMVPWKSVLNPTKIQQVAAFVMSLEGTNPPNAKPPQGDLYEN